MKLFRGYVRTQVPNPQFYLRGMSISDGWMDFLIIQCGFEGADLPSERRKGDRRLRSFPAKNVPLTSNQIFRQLINKNLSLSPSVVAHVLPLPLLCHHPHMWKMKKIMIMMVMIMRWRKSQTDSKPFLGEFGKISMACLTFNQSSNFLSLLVRISANVNHSLRWPLLRH